MPGPSLPRLRQVEPRKEVKTPATGDQSDPWICCTQLETPWPLGNHGSNPIKPADRKISWPTS